MHIPDLDELRPGDFVKVRGSSNATHSGGKAVVVAVHRAEGPPWQVVALDLRYSARGAAIRVEIADSGEMARWETPWQPEHTVEDDEQRHHELLAPGAAHVAVPATSRRKTAVAGLAVLLAVAGLAAWEHQRGSVSPDPVVVQRALQEGARGTGVPTAGQLTATPTPSSSTVAAAFAVVAYAAGPVPVVSGPDGTDPTPLAGVEPASGCRDAYVKDLLSFLPVGQRVDVSGAGWFRTDDGLDVNAELVRSGVAVPVASTAGTSSTDTDHFEELRSLAAEASSDCR